MKRKGLWVLPEDPIIYTREEWAALSEKERGPCDEWESYCTPDGYGRFHLNGKGAYAHRVMWLNTFGDIPEKTPCVLHHCDRPPCCRLSHLFLGTHKDNALDREAKGRHAHAHRISIRKCGMPGCGNKHYAKGLCHPHYDKDRKS